MSEFTKEQLRSVVSQPPITATFAIPLSVALAASHLAALERAENAEAERDALSVQLSAWHRTFETTQLTHAKARLASAEAERDRLKGELEEAEEAILYFAKKVDRARPARFSPVDTRRTVIFSCKEDGTWDHVPACSIAVRRARERGGRG